MTEPCGRPVLSQLRRFDVDKPLSLLCLSYSEAAKAAHLPPLSVRLSAVLSGRGSVSMCIPVCVCVRTRADGSLCVCARAPV